MSEAPGFRCTRCGDCCRNFSEERMVLLLPGEIAQLAAGLGCDAAEAKRRFTAPIPAFAELGVTARRLRAVDGACVFLTADGSCGVHAFKPYQCRKGPDRFLAGWMGDYACMRGLDARAPAQDDLEFELFRLLLTDEEETG